MGSGLHGEIGNDVLSRVVAAANHEGVPVQTHHHPTVEETVRERIYSLKDVQQIFVLEVRKYISLSMFYTTL